MLPCFDGTELAMLLVVSLVLDLCLGELPTSIHPVVWIGRLIRSVVSRLPRKGTRALASGLILALGLPVCLSLLTWSVLALLVPLPWVALPVATFLLTSSFSVRLLGHEARELALLIEGRQLERARSQLGHLCSRDAAGLDGSQVAGAVVESVAENASDSYVAPLFWFCLLGVPGAIFFRVANTMDAVIGYRGEFELLGKAAARLDDLLCWLPARLTAVMILCAGALSGGSPMRGLRILVRDRSLTLSPNSGYPMAAMAGVLGIRLVKVDEYELGSEGEDPGVGAIRHVVRILGLTATLATGVAVAVLLFLR